MSAMQTGCGCSRGGNAESKIIFSCSGCADVGELADQFTLPEGSCKLRLRKTP